MYLNRNRKIIVKERKIPQTQNKDRYTALNYNLVFFSYII